MAFQSAQARDDDADERLGQAEVSARAFTIGTVRTWGYPVVNDTELSGSVWQLEASHRGMGHDGDRRRQVPLEGCAAAGVHFPMNRHDNGSSRHHLRQDRVVQRRVVVSVYHVRCELAEVSKGTNASFDAPLTQHFQHFRLYSGGEQVLFQRTIVNRHHADSMTGLFLGRGSRKTTCSMPPSLRLETV